MFRVACAGFGAFLLAGCVGRSSGPQYSNDTEAVERLQQAEPASQAEAQVSPFVGRWEIDRASTWLTVWELAFGMAKEADMPADLYDEMAAKIDEVVDSMAVVMTLDEDGSLIFESQMMGQAEISQGTWAMREDGSVDLTAQSEQSGETIAIGSIGGDQFVMISPVDPSGFGTIKFNRVSK